MSKSYNCAATGFRAVYRLRSAAVLGGAMLLTACGGLIDLPGAEDAPQIYRLTVADAEPVPSGGKSWRILVDEPDASRAINTDRIALHPSPVELQYYAKARWADRAPRLVQNLLLDALEKQDSIAFAGRTASGTSAPYMLTGSLTDFQTIYEDGKPEITVTLKLNLVDQRTADIISSKVFQARSAPDRNDVRSIVMAFNESTTTVINDAIGWTIATMSGL